MTKIAPGPWRWMSTVIALGLAATLSGCIAVDLGDLVESDDQSSKSSSGDQNAEPQATAAQLAAAECFSGMWQMDNATMSSMLIAADILVSDSIEGTSLLVVEPDGTAKVEHIGWTYVVKAPPNPMLGGQAPTTTTITNDSSQLATYGIEDDGTILLTVVDEGAKSTSSPSARVLTCEGDRVLEEVVGFDTEIVYNRRT